MDGRFGVDAVSRPGVNTEPYEFVADRRAVTSPLSLTVATVVLLDVHSALTFSRTDPSDISMSALSLAVCPTLSLRLSAKAVGAWIERVFGVGAGAGVGAVGIDGPPPPLALLAFFLAVLSADSCDCQLSRNQSTANGISSRGSPLRGWPGGTINAVRDHSASAPTGSAWSTTATTGGLGAPSRYAALARKRARHPR